VTTTPHGGGRARPGRTARGVDVSAPQAGAVLPADAAFGVVGIDGDTFATLNPDFPRQWQT